VRQRTGHWSNELLTCREAARSLEELDLGDVDPLVHAIPELSEVHRRPPRREQPSSRPYPLGGADRVLVVREGGPRVGPYASKGSTGEPLGMAVNSSKLLAARVGFERSTGSRTGTDGAALSRTGSDPVAEDRSWRSQRGPEATHGRVAPKHDFQSARKLHEGPPKTAGVGQGECASRRADGASCDRPEVAAARALVEAGLAALAAGDIVAARAAAKGLLAYLEALPVMAGTHP